MGRLRHVEAPAQAYGWVRERFGRVLQACVTSVLGARSSIELVPAGCVRLQIGVGGVAAQPHRPPCRGEGNRSET